MRCFSSRLRRSQYVSLSMAYFRYIPCSHLKMFGRVTNEEHFGFLASRLIAMNVGRINSKAALCISNTRLRLPVLRTVYHSPASRPLLKSLMTCPACDNVIPVDTYAAHVCTKSCPDCGRSVPTRKRFQHACYRQRRGLEINERCADCGKLILVTSQSQHKCYRKRTGLQVRLSAIYFWRDTA